MVCGYQTIPKLSMRNTVFFRFLPVEIFNYVSTFPEKMEILQKSIEHVMKIIAVLSTG